MHLEDVLVTQLSQGYRWVQHILYLMGVLHLWALFLKTLCIFSKNKANLDKVSYGSGQKCSKELKNHSFTSVEAIVVKLQRKMCENQYFPCFEPVLWVGKLLVNLHGKLPVIYHHHNLPWWNRVKWVKYKKHKFCFKKINNILLCFLLCLFRSDMNSYTISWISPSPVIILLCIINWESVLKYIVEFVQCL